MVEVLTSVFGRLVRCGVESDSRVGGSRSLQEELNRAVRWQDIDFHGELSWSSEPVPARHQRSKLVLGGEHFGHEPRRVRKLLNVVDHEQSIPVLQLLVDIPPLTLWLVQIEGLSKQVLEPGGVGCVAQLDEVGAIPKVVPDRLGDAEPESGFSDAAGSKDRD